MLTRESKMGNAPFLTSTDIRNDFPRCDTSLLLHPEIDNAALHFPLISLNVSSPHPTLNRTAQQNTANEYLVFTLFNQLAS